MIFLPCFALPGFLSLRGAVHWRARHPRVFALLGSRCQLRSSGVRGVSREKTGQRWQVSQQLPGGRQKNTNFPAARWAAEGLPFEEAVARALEAAKAFRLELQRSGAAKTPDPALPRSGVRGVTWQKSKRRWQVQVTATDPEGRKYH